MVSISARKTETGNYILNLKGAGYGINGGDDYHPASGEYIIYYGGSSDISRLRKLRLSF